MITLSNLLKAFCILFLTTASSAVPVATFAQSGQVPKETPSASKETTQKSAAPLLDMIKSSQENKSKMRSKNWNTDKYQQKVTKQKEKEQEPESTDKKDNDIWEHYNTLANRNIKSDTNTILHSKRKQASEASCAECSKLPEYSETEGQRTHAKKANWYKNEKSPEEEPEEKEVKPESPPKTKQEKQTEEISDIVERYKQSQKKQGPMNSRSYGPID